MDEGGIDSPGPTGDETAPDVPAIPLTVQIGAPAPPGQDLVVAGVVAKSTSYTLYSTVGEGPGSNGVMSSPGYKMISGLLGTTQP
jgi:hypothetical protein